MCKRFVQTDSVEKTLEKVSVEKLLQFFLAEVQAHCRDKEPTGLYETADLIAGGRRDSVQFRQALDVQAQSRKNSRREEASVEWTSLREGSGNPESLCPNIYFIP